MDTVYHAAAYKHVPLVEENICEGVKNNVFSTLAVVKASVAKKFLVLYLYQVIKQLGQQMLWELQSDLLKYVCKVFMRKIVIKT